MVETLLTRDPQTLASQTALVVRYLRTPSAGRAPTCLQCGRPPRFTSPVCFDCGGQLLTTDQDAAATASPGWRPIDWEPDRGPCTAADCAAQHDHSPHPSHTQRWQAEIDGSLDRWPRHLVARLPGLLAQLSPLDQDIVDQVARGYASFRHVGRELGRDDHTIRAHYDAALVWLARGLWDDDGQPV